MSTDFDELQKLLEFAWLMQCWREGFEACLEEGRRIVEEYGR
jgi:hypothetical protein